MRTSAVLPALVLLLAAQSVPAPPPAPEPAADPAAEQLGYREHAVSGRMTVPVAIAGQGPFDFIVDTGSERTVVSRELAERLALPAGPAVTLYSATDIASVATAQVPGLNFGARAVGAFRAPLLGERDLGAAGLIGIDALQSHRVHFDFEARQLTIEPSPTNHQALRQGAGDDVIVVTARSRLGRLVVADARVNGQPVVAIIDTGAELSLGNMALFRALQSNARLPEGRIVPLTSVTGRTVDVDVRRTGRVRVGGLTLTDLNIAFADTPLFQELGYQRRPALLLGMNAMRAFRRVSIDFRRRQVRFELPLSLDPQAGGTRLACAQGASTSAPTSASRSAAITASRCISNVPSRSARLQTPVTVRPSADSRPT